MLLAKFSLARIYLLLLFLFTSPTAPMNTFLMASPSDPIWKVMTSGLGYFISRLQNSSVVEKSLLKSPNTETK